MIFCKIEVIFYFLFVNLFLFFKFIALFVYLINKAIQCSKSDNMADVKCASGVSVRLDLGA